MVNYVVQSSLVAAITNLSLAVFVVTKSPRSSIHRTFSLLGLLIFLWNMGTVLNRPQLIYVAVSFLPVAALHFTRWYIGERRQVGVLKLCYALSLGFALIGVAGLLERAVYKYLLTLYLTPVALTIIFKLYQRRAETGSRLERLQLTYLMVGSLAALGCGVTDYLASIGLPIPRLGSLGSLLYVVIIAVAIVRYRLLNVHLLIGRSIVLLAFTFLVWSLSGVAGVWWTGNIYNSFFAILAATVLILILYEPLKGLIERQTDKVLKRQSLELVNQLNRLSLELASVITLKDLQSSLTIALRGMTKIKRFAIYWATDDGSNFQFIDGSAPPPRHYVTLSDDTRLLEQFRLQKRPIDRDELQRELELWLLPQSRDRIRDVFRMMTTLGVNLCLPFFHQDSVLGFLALRSSEEEEYGFSQRERDLLSAIGNQIGVAIATARIHETLKKNDRLIALGEMAAGLAHEIRNPLASIKAAAQFIDTDNESTEHREFLRIIIDEVNRLNTVVSRFLDYARPVSSSHQRIDLNAIILRMADLIRPRCKAASITIELDLCDQAQVLGDQDELKQVCLNLLSNAVDSIGQDGTLTITTSANAETGASSHAGSSLITMEVLDTGPGILPEDLDKVFNPFFTTKEQGTGLGLAIVYKIIEGHKGSIEAQNRLTRGARFIVKLPKVARSEQETAESVKLHEEAR